MDILCSTLCKRVAAYSYRESPLVHPPSLIHLVRSSYIPPNDHIDSLRAAVQLEDRRIRKLDEEIAVLVDALTLLRRERQVCLEIRAEYASLLIPIRKLPREILAGIMLWAISGVERHRLDSSTPQPVTILSQVCVRWRETVLSTPELWTTVVCYGPTQEKWCSLSLERSLQMPLRIIIHDRSEDEPIPSSYGGFAAAFSRGLPVPGEAFKLLMVHSERWVSLQVGNMEDSLSTLLSSIRGRLPSLHTLDLEERPSYYQRGFTITDSNGGVWDTFSNTPSLRKLRISSPFYLSATAVPWKQLTTLFVSGMDASTIQDMVKWCTALVYLTVEIISVDRSSDRHPMITLAHLTSLTIGPPPYQADQFGWISRGDDSSSLYQRWITPSLTRIDLEIVDTNSDRLTPLVSRSSCHIKELAITTRHLSRDTVLAYLEVMPALERIDILTAECTGSCAYTTHNSAFVPWLQFLGTSNDDGSPSYCRQLAHFSISDGKHISEVGHVPDRDLLASFFKTRAGGRLERFEIEVPGVTDDAQWEALLPLQESGDVYLFSSLERKTAFVQFSSLQYLQVPTGARERVPYF